jgi:hypothetical protein
VDVPSSVIRFDPKLPPGVPDAEFTVTMGSHPVSGSYHREGEASRMMLSLSRYPRPVKWHFVWPFDGGDAWVGSIRVEPGTTVTIVASPKGILAYEGEHEVRLDEKWFIRGFARSRELAALHLAAPPR